MRRFLASLALALGLLGLASAEASTTSHPVPSIAAMRATNWGAYDILNLTSYYDSQNQGGGNFTKSGASCITSVTGAITSGQASIKNLSGPVYIGETISNPNVPANTTISAIGFNRVLSGGIWTNGATSLTSIPDTTNIAVGMTVNGVRIAVGSKVTSVTAPSTVVTVHGSIHNGRVITVTSATGIVPGMYVTAIANNDAIPKVFPDSVTVPGVDVVSTVVGTTITTTGSLGLVGVSSDMTFHFTSTDGAVGISTPTTGAEASSTPLLFYQNNATMSANATGTSTSATLSLNGDDGGMHIVDSAGNCWVRQQFPDVLGWGAKPDGSTDNTGSLQNDITYNSISTQAGPAGGVLFPSGINGIFVTNELFVFKPVPFIGQGLETTILQQKAGLAAQTPTIYYFSLYDESNRWSSTYLPMGTSIRNLTVRGPSDSTSTGLETIGVYYDGFNSNPQVTDSDVSRAFIQELQIDQFKGFGLYAARASGVIGSLYKVQIRGITTDLSSNDCFHSDGPNTWGTYYIITSACDSGLYLMNPTSWTFFRAVAFSNNHAATITGTDGSNGNNAQINFYDFEYGFNKQNAIVLDQQGIRFSCSHCRVNDTGTVATAGVYSDIEITANAGVNTGPMAEITNNYFTQVHSEASGQNHLNNFTFDDGATAQVAVDATTTTSSSALTLWNNLATCDGGSGPGTCTASLTYPPALIPPGTGLITQVVSPSASPVNATASDCGKLYDAGSVVLTVNLPVTPSAACAFTFMPRAGGITINPNGNSIMPAYGSAYTTSIVLPATSNSNRSYMTLEWGGNGIWYVGPSSPILLTALFPQAGQSIAHGQVYFSYCVSSCGLGGALSAQFQLCQYNGPGGLIINGQLRQVPSGCEMIPSSATTSSALNNFYAVIVNATVSAIADNGSGKARLTVNAAAGFHTGSPITCYSMTGTPLANVTDDQNTVAVDATHIDLTDVNFVATGAGFCQAIGVSPVTTTHKTFNGIEVNNASNAQTFVGSAYIGPANAVTDCTTPGPSCNVVSQYNRQRKKMVVVCGAGVTTGNGTSTTTYKTPATVCEGDFTAIGPPSIPGTYPASQIHWMVNGAVANSFIAGTTGTSVCLGTSAKSGNATCTAEPEEAFATQDVAANYQSANVQGMTATVSQGHNFIDLAGFATGTTPTATYNNGHTTIGMELWQ